MEKPGARSTNDLLLTAYRYNRMNTLLLPAALIVLSVAIFLMLVVCDPSYTLARMTAAASAVYVVLLVAWFCTRYREEKLLEEYNARTEV